MPTIVASNSAELAAALRAPVAGTTIELTSGSYTLSIRSKDLAGTVITAADGATASFSSVSLQSASHLTFDGVDFLDRSGTGKPFVVANSTDVTIRDATVDGLTPNGYGVGNGLWISNNNGFTLEDSRITDFQTGAWVGGNTDLVIRDNSFSNITLDGMIIGRTHNALFSGNTIDLHSTPGLRHSDGMQFYNSGENAPSTDVTVEDNIIRTHNKQSHGIYMGNAIANETRQHQRLLPGRADPRKHHPARRRVRHRLGADQRPDHSRQHHPARHRGDAGQRPRQRPAHPRP